MRKILVHVLVVSAIACGIPGKIAASAESRLGSSVKAARAPANFPVPKYDPERMRDKVVGGAPSHDRKVVGISFVDNAGIHRICSGLWLSRQFVLTAAHCTCENSRNEYLVTNSDVATNNWIPAKLQSRFDAQFCKSSEARHGNDLALLALGTERSSAGPRWATCDDYSLIEDIKLAGVWLREPPQRIMVAGYGFEGDTPGSLGQRRAASVGVNSLSCGQPLAQQLGCWPLKEMILGAGRTDGAIRDTCGGDSGGPAYVVQNGLFLPVAIVSRGLPIPHSYPTLGICGAGGIYTVLGRTNVIAWLRSAGVTSGRPNCDSKTGIQ